MANNGQVAIKSLTTFDIN